MSFPAPSNHLRNEIERDDGQRADGRQRAHRRRLEAEGGHIGKREAAEIAQSFGDQEEHDGPAHEPADGIDQAVEAGGEHQAGYAEERRGGHEVARDGEAVLEAGDAAACCIEVGGGPCP
jgi:hypothetical protein